MRGLCLDLEWFLVFLGVDSILVGQGRPNNPLHLTWFQVNYLFYHYK